MMRRRLLFATLLVVALTAACELRFSQVPACDRLLPGSPELVDIDAAQVPITCEERDPATPSSVVGFWDGSIIHVLSLPAGVTVPDEYVLRIAGHEFGHALTSGASAPHQDWLVTWATLRSITPTQAVEDFAESFAFCIYPRPNGVPYGPFAGLSPTAAECSAMHKLYDVR